MNLNLKNKPILIVALLAVIFFFIYSFLNFSNPTPHFTWPDETANYFFINNFIHYSSFSVPEPLNSMAGELIKPRSFNVYQGNMVPGSFLGMLLIYGLIGKIVGIGLVKFLTPLLAAIAGLFFYKILLRVFDSKIAFISTLLFYLNPAWWYYANFAMLPNIAFLTFLLIGIYWLLKIDKNIKQLNYLWVVLGAFFVGLALTIRTNELLWILGILALLLIVYKQKIKWQYVVIFGAILILLFVPIFYYNQVTYGNYLSFGYLRLSNGDNLADQLPTEFKSASSDLINLVKFVVLPFGVNPTQILVNLYKYAVRLFWWQALLAVVGMFIFLKKYQSKTQATYFLIAFCVTLYLGVYYGSWVFADQLTLTLNKLGISYVRYFLPIYILGLPFVAIASVYFVNLFKNYKIRILTAIFLALMIIGFSLTTLFLSGEDNLVKTSLYLNSYKDINETVLAATPANAVIISQRSDKIFFPERRVMGRWQAKDFQYWATLLDGNIPLYYYAYESEDFISKLDNELSYYSMELAAKTEITDKEALYKIDWIPYEDME
jgi:hypothetical protein